MKMNYSKYHQTANFTSGTSTGAAGNSHSSHQNFGHTAASQSSRAASNSRIYSHHQGGSSSNIREGQSVERLKSCIADLKKLATNKVKRGSSQAPSMIGASKRERTTHSNATPEDSSIGYQYGVGGAGGSSRDVPSYQQHLYAGGGGQNYATGGSSKHKSSSVQGADYSHGHGGSSKRPSKQSASGHGSIHGASNHNGTARESSSHAGGNERKQHSTKIANALKKYINEIEQTTTQLSHTGTRGGSGYHESGTSRTGRDSHRARSSNQPPKRASTAGKTRPDPSGSSSLHGNARHSTAQASGHYPHRSERDSHHFSGQGGYPSGSGYINPHMTGSSTGKSAPRAHSSKHLGGTSTSRTNANFGQDHALVQAQSNHLNQSKRSVATAHNYQQMENSMKMSQMPSSGGYSQHNYASGQHHNSHHQNGEPVQTYSKQPRKAASQDRMARDTGNGGAHQSSNMSHSNAFGHSTFSNLNASVLGQKRSNSTSHYKGSATKKSSSHNHHYSGSTKKSSSTTRHGYGHKEHGSHNGSAAVTGHAYGTSAQMLNDMYGPAQGKTADSKQTAQNQTRNSTQQHSDRLSSANQRNRGDSYAQEQYSRGFSDPSAKQSNQSTRQSRQNETSASSKQKPGYSEIEKRRPSHNSKQQSSQSAAQGTQQFQSQPRLLANNFVVQEVTTSGAGHHTGGKDSKKAHHHKELKSEPDEEAISVKIDQSQSRVRDGFKKAAQQPNSFDPRLDQKASSVSQSHHHHQVAGSSRQPAVDMMAHAAAAQHKFHQTDSSSQGHQQQLNKSGKQNFTDDSDGKIANSFEINQRKASQQLMQQQATSYQQATTSHQNSSSIYSMQQAANAHMTASSLQQTAQAAAVNNIQAGITYKTSLMRTNANCREDMNIEDIHCQIVMRRQRNNQILRELEGGPAEQSEFFGMSHNLYEQAGEDTFPISRHNSAKRTGSLLATAEHNNTCVQIQEGEFLGPDYCSKRPVFLPIHFPQMLQVTGAGAASSNNQQAQQQAQQEPFSAQSQAASAKHTPSTAPQRNRSSAQPLSTSKSSASNAPRPKPHGGSSSYAKHQQSSSSQYSHSNASHQQQSRRSQHLPSYGTGGHHGPQQVSHGDLSAGQNQILQYQR